MNANDLFNLLPAHIVINKPKDTPPERTEMINHIVDKASMLCMYCTHWQCQLSIL